MTTNFEQITRAEAIDFLLPRHYSGRVPAVSYAYAIRIDQRIVAVVTYGKPASPALCKGVCGEANSEYVYELNRLCRIDEYNEPLSKFVAWTLRQIAKDNRIIVSYADSGVGHNGYIYQALNFMYTGKTKERLQFHVPNGHSRHGNKESNLREIRTAKHRYIMFATNNRKLKQQWSDALNYPPMPYPKETSTNYKLGTIYKPQIVEIHS